MQKPLATEVSNPSHIAWQGPGLKLGLFLPHSGPLASPRFLKEVAVEAEELGFTALWVVDAPARPPGDRVANFYEPLTILGWLAAVTSRVALGTGVLVLPYRNPVLLARSLAAIDQLSDGRLILGVGVGHVESENRILGAPPYQERGRVSNEWLRILNSFWTDERPQFAGRYVRFDAEELYPGPRPIQVPGPPILVGGASRAAMRRALRFGDGYFPIVRPIDEMKKQLTMLGEEAERQARSLDEFPVLALGWSNILSEPERTNGDRETLTGTASQVTEDLFELQELGLRHVGLFFRHASNEEDFRRQMQAAAREVMPALARSAR
jgi:probable F420-dependent oxidoreductase